MNFYATNLFIKICFIGGNKKEIKSDDSDLENILTSLIEKKKAKGKIKTYNNIYCLAWVIFRIF